MLDQPSRARWLAVVVIALATGCSSPTDEQQREPQPRTFTVGGSVSGLAGSGLAIRDRKTGTETRPTSDGPFTIDTGLTDGTEFDVVVETQPQDPLQTCTVSGGTGTITGASVTGIGVACITDDRSSGVLDESFGDHGRVIAPLPGGATAMAVQPDGRIIVAGESKVMRFGVDGALDTSFGNAGETDFTFPDVPNAVSNLPQGIAIRNDGHIVVVGFSESSSDAGDRFVVAQYNADGTLDSNFGGDGRVIVDFDARSARGRGVVLNAEGKIVVAGEALLGANNFDSADVVVAQLTSTGQFDDTFGDEGRTHTHFQNATVEVHGVVREIDGRIVIVGSVATVRREGVDLAVVSLTSDGAPDTTFARAGGTPGQLRTNLDLTDAELHANAATIQDDGEIAIAGEVDTGGSIQFLLVRVSAEGTFRAPILSSFSEQGDRATAIAPLPGGDVVVVGRTALSGSSDFRIVRYSGIGGVTISQRVDFFGGRDGAQAVAVQPSGRSVVAGFAQNGSSAGLGLVRATP